MGALQKTEFESVKQPIFSAVQQLIVLAVFLSSFAAADTPPVEVMPAHLIWTHQEGGWNTAGLEREFRDPMAAAQEFCEQRISFRHYFDINYSDSDDVGHGQYRFIQAGCGLFGPPWHLLDQYENRWIQNNYVEYHMTNPELRSKDGGLWQGDAREESILSGVLPTYTATLTQISPYSSCKTGNPIEVSTGAKIQQEAENLGFPDLPFILNYSNSNPQLPPQWQNNYQRSLQPYNPYPAPGEISPVRAKSNSYGSHAEACTSGWRDIANQINAPWTQNAVASYNCGRCEITKNNIHIATLAVVEDAVPFAEVSASKQEALRLKREDGSEWTFINVQSDCGGPSWQAVDGNSPYTLTTDSNGNFLLSTAGGPVESYDSSGHLRSITAPNG